MKFSKNLRKAALVMLAGSMIFAASCQGKNDTPGVTVAEPDGKDYTFTHSSDWTVLRDDSMYAIESPKSEITGKSANISVMYVDIDDRIENYVSEETTDRAGLKSALLDAYVPKYMDAVKAEYGSLVYDGNITDAQINGEIGKTVTYSYKDPFTEEEFFFETTVAVLQTNSYCYCYYITYTASGKETFDEFHGEMVKVVSNFNFN